MKGITKYHEYNKYNQFLISTMKWITKYHESITKDYESFFYSMKDQCKKKLCVTCQAIHSSSQVLGVRLLRF